MLKFSIVNPATNERDLWITLCLTCQHEGQMSWLDRQPDPGQPPAHACGFCGAPPRVCVGCGCSDFAACEGGCYWVDAALTDGQPVCSNCYQRAMREAGQRAGRLVTL